MFTYSCLNNISDIGLSHFTDDFRVASEGENAQAILVRSANMKEMNFDKSLLCIARAGAGVNNIPVDRCAEEGIVVFNTPGANANGVKELVIAGLLLSSRDIVGGIEWLRSEEPGDDIGKVVEKQKKLYAGNEIAGKKLGVIGLGAIGVMVANAAVGLGMEVYGYDPYLSLKAAWNLSRAVHYCKELDDIYANSDYITIHVPLNDGTREMVNKDALDKMKDGTVLLNFARDLLVDEKAVLEALESGRLKKYVTDFATPAVVKHDNTIVTPHLGASTAESEDNCAVMAVDQVSEFLENGNIRNSVNFPACDMGVCQTAGRIAIIHRNVPNIISGFTGVLGAARINVANIQNVSRGEYAYTLMDVDSELNDGLVGNMEAIDGVLKVRIVK